MKKFLFLLLASALFLSLPPQASADSYNCGISLQQSFNLTMNPTTFAQGDSVTFTVSSTPYLLPPCSPGDTVILCIDRREDTSNVYCSLRQTLALDASCNATFTTTNVPVDSDLSTHTAELMDGVLVGVANSCSNIVPFEITGAPPPSSCRGIGDDCCVTQDGTCLFPGNDCCNICSSPPGLYCNASLRVDNLMCGTNAGSLCCDSQPRCQSDLIPTSVGNPPVCICQGRRSDTASIISEGCGPGGGQAPGIVNTAIGCIPFDIISKTSKFFLAWGISVGGGVALFLIGLAGIMFATSAGKPEKVNSAKSLLWSALTGLGMLLLSVFLLRFIGVDVLGLFS